ncbi:MAG: hypothetical protein R3248_15410 [Candidatus Promineifilaceae bacterium]|nr:hypothetical protein [Candidatus Promineifilaceae bacterium]
MTTDFAGLFFFEGRDVTCGAFTYYQDVLRRTSRGGGPVDSLLAYPAGYLELLDVYLPAVNRR